MSGPLAPLVLGTQLLLVASGAPPQINVEETCRRSQAEIISLFGEETLATFDGCMRQQREALDKLRQDWATYPAAERNRCVRIDQYMPSYVEWLTCLETGQALKEIREKNLGTSGSGVEHN